MSVPSRHLDHGGSLRDGEAQSAPVGVAHQGVYFEAGAVLPDLHTSPRPTSHHVVPDTVYRVSATAVVDVVAVVGLFAGYGVDHLPLEVVTSQDVVEGGFSG